MSKSSRYIATGGHEDQCVKLWDTQAHQQQLKSAMTAAAVGTADSTRIRREVSLLNRHNMEAESAADDVRVLYHIAV